MYKLLLSFMVILDGYRSFILNKTKSTKFCLVNSCIYYACHTCGIYQVLPYSVDFKAPQELWNPLSKAVPGKFHRSGGHCKYNCL